MASIKHQLLNTVMASLFLLISMNVMLAIEARNLVPLKKDPSSSRLICAEVRVSQLCQNAVSVNFHYNDGCRNCRCLLPCSLPAGNLQYRNHCTDRGTSSYCRAPVSNGETRFCQYLGTENIRLVGNYRSSGQAPVATIQQC